MTTMIANCAVDRANIDVSSSLCSFLVLVFTSRTRVLPGGPLSLGVEFTYTVTQQT